MKLRSLFLLSLSMNRKWVRGSHEATSSRNRPKMMIFNNSSWLNWAFFVAVVIWMFLVLNCLQLEIKSIDWEREKWLLIFTLSYLSCVMGQSGFGGWRREVKCSSLKWNLVCTRTRNSWVRPMLGCGGKGKYGGFCFKFASFFFWIIVTIFFYFVLADIVIHLLKNKRRTAVLVTVNAKVNVRS